MEFLVWHRVCRYCDDDQTERLSLVVMGMRCQLPTGAWRDPPGSNLLDGR